MPLGGIGRGKRREAFEQQQQQQAPGGLAQASRGGHPHGSQAPHGHGGGFGQHDNRSSDGFSNNDYNNRGGQQNYNSGGFPNANQARGGFPNGDDRRFNQNGRGGRNDFQSHGAFGGDGFSDGDRNRDGDNFGGPPRPHGGDGGFEGGSGEARGPPKPSTYVPEDVSAEELFREEHILPGIDFEREYGLDFDQLEERLKPKVTFPGERKPITKTFDDMDLHIGLSRNIARMKFKHPTPIQAYSMPYLSAGCDLMACAQTGSGKTAAFLFPVINWLLRRDDLQEHSRVPSPFALIVAPTRELQTQTMREAVRFCYETDIKVGQLYGQTSVREQKARLERGCHILTATMGRLWQFIQEGWVSLERLKFVILDEADRMLDQGFGADIERMMRAEGMPPKGTRQTMMFSATFPGEIQRLASEYLVDDRVFISIGEVGSVAGSITQTVMEVGKYNKKEALLDLLRTELNNHNQQETGEAYKCVIFTAMKRQSDFLGLYLSEERIKATTIHGDREQAEREEALKQFKTGKCPVIIATDVIARGIDIDHVHHVINYDMPTDIETYVHRIGRTGRVGHPGKATSFYDPDRDSALQHDLVKKLSDSQQEVPAFLQAGGGYGAAAAAADDGWG